jgi:TolB protein
VRQGPWLSDWSGPPVNANYLAFGYAAIQGDQLVLSGWLYDVAQQDISNAQVIGKRYLGSMDEAGARKVAQEFAADILARFGGTSLMGSRIFFVSTRGGNKEIWSMDYDGSNQKQLTFYKTISTFPAVAPDGSKFAFTSYLGGRPAILVHSVETGRNLRFYNQAASMNAASDFTPDGQQLVLSSTAGNLRYAQLFIANVDGSNLRRLSNSLAIEVEPKVNPKTGRELVFVSGRSGMPQIYRMNMDGADVTRLTTGEGEAVNPAWRPDGQFIAFAWTRGFEPGNYNIFVMDVATRQLVQLTHGTGRNENPSWAPDGRHIVFSSNRDGGQQIWTMLADGTELKKLTTQGSNEKPVWSRQ